jgi:hypothetical protein
LGGVYKQGVALARFEYVTWAPGDNENPGEALVPVFEAIGKADIVVPYPANMGVRPLSRRVISRSYTLLMNVLFGHWLPYYNGTAVCPTARLRDIEIRTSSFAYHSEILVKLLRSGCSYTTVGINIQPQPNRKSKAFHLRNVVTVVKAIVSLFFEVHFQRAPQKPKPAVTPAKEPQS